ncbi:hypothetical protein GGR58DRAFT_504575 [Xylaria digitata]|nr:hypothetical protein GGR58DRAFT_504575 [Xylaria digitata]
MAALPPPSGTTEEEWDHYKETILSLYLGTGYDEGQRHGESNSQTLYKLAESMRLNHGFTASVSQFEARLKVWGARKNLRPREWKPVFERLDRLPRTTKSRVVISDRAIHKDKVSRARRRYYKKSRAVAGVSALDPSINSTLPEQVHIEVLGPDGRWVQLSETATTPPLRTLNPSTADARTETQDPRELVARNNDDAAQGNATAHMLTRGRNMSVNHLVSEVAMETTLSSNRAINAVPDLDIGLDQGMPLEQASERITTAPHGNTLTFSSFMEISDPSSLVNFSLSPQGGGAIDWNPPLAFDIEPLPVNSLSPSSTPREFIGPHWVENHQLLSPRATHASFGTAVEQIQNSYSSAVTSANWLHIPASTRMRQRHQWVPPSAAIVAELVAELVKDITNNVQHTATDEIMPRIFNLANCFLDEINASAQTTMIRTANLQHLAITLTFILNNLLSAECLFGEEFIESSNNSATQFAVEARLHSRLITSVINGFAGLQNIPVAGVLRFLSRHPTIQVSMIRFLNPDSNPVSKSLAENIFRAALEDDNVDIIKYLLDYSKLVHTNDTVCHYDEGRCTPLRRAIMAKSFGAARLLIDRVVDVNQRFRGFDPLHELLDPINPRSTLDDGLLGLFDALLLAGTTIGEYHIQKALEFSDPRIAIRLIEKSASESPGEFFLKYGLLLRIIENFEETDATRMFLLIIENCKRIGVDWCRGKYSYGANNALYEAARRGYKELVEAFGDESIKGFVSLIVALQSRDQNRLLLLGERDILRHFEQHQLRDVLTVALEEGNQQFTARILDLNPYIQGWQISYY